MANKLLGIFLFLILSAYSAPSKAQTPDEWTVRQGSGEAETLYTENPPPGYTNEMEARVKAELPPHRDNRGANRRNSTSPEMHKAA
jgi:hypothetical protein